MIETIFSNENGEVNRTSAGQTAFRMPRNVRQVGKSNPSKKIYVEDYVMTFIKQLAGGEYSGCSIAVLVGQCIKVENCRNIFISGAVGVKNIETLNDVVFTNDIWTEIYEDIKKYFVETEIVGWFMGGPGYLFSEEDKILKLHIDNFAGQDKVLLTYDNLEKEESFLSYENNQLCKQDGYYIYYEKNEDMQNYIIDHKKEESIETSYDDKVSREIRAVIQNKKPVEEDSKSATRLMYAAGTLLAVIVLIVGAAMLRNYDQMKNMQETLNYLSKNIGSSDADPDSKPASDKQAAVTGKAENDPKDADDDSLDVEVVPGNVKPLVKNKNDAAANGKQNNEEGTVSDKELAQNGTSGKAADTKASEAAKTDTAKTDAEKSDVVKTDPQKSDTVKTDITKSTATKPVATGSDNAAKAPDKQGTSSNAKSGTAKTARSDSPKPVKQEINYYVVADGDTLADISYKLYKTYTKVKTIMKLNNIENKDCIYIGQKLIVP
jgi:Uncharacterized protein containing LysM domain